jgi:hypothetical protein
VGGQRHAPAALPPGKTRYPLYRRLGGTQGRSGLVRKNSPKPAFDPRTVQPIASRYTDWAIPTDFSMLGSSYFIVCIWSSNKITPVPDPPDFTGISYSSSTSLSEYGHSMIVYRQSQRILHSQHSAPVFLWDRRFNFPTHLPFFPIQYSALNSTTHHFCWTSDHTNGRRVVCRRLFQVRDERQRYFQMYTEQEAFVSPSGEEFNISAPVYSVVNKANAYIFS